MRFFKIFSVLIVSFLAGNIYILKSYSADSQLQTVPEYSYTGLKMVKYNSEYFYFRYETDSCDLEVKRARLHSETNDFIERNWQEGGTIGFSFPQSSVEHSDCPGIAVDQPTAEVPAVDVGELKLHQDPEWEKLGYYAFVNRSSDNITVEYDHAGKTATLKAGVCAYIDADSYVTLSSGNTEICDTRCSDNNCTTCPEPGSYTVNKSGSSWSVTNINKDQLDDLSCDPL